MIKVFILVKTPQQLCQHSSVVFLQCLREILDIWDAPEFHVFRGCTVFWQASFEPILVCLMIVIPLQRIAWICLQCCINCLLGTKECLRIGVLIWDQVPAAHLILCCDLKRQIFSQLHSETVYEYCPARGKHPVTSRRHNDSSFGTQPPNFTLRHFMNTALHG